MTVAIVCLVLSLLIGAGIAVIDWPYYRLAGLVTGTILVATVLITWAIVAWAWSPYQKDRCAEKAEAYQLPDAEWSWKHDCRVYLRTGQLVPEDRIRVMTDGQIVVTDD